MSGISLRERVAIMLAGIVCAPLFLVGVWFACWLLAGAPL